MSTIVYAPKYLQITQQRSSIGTAYCNGKQTMILHMHLIFTIYKNVTFKPEPTIVQMSRAEPANPKHCVKLALHVSAGGSFSSERSIKAEAKV